MGTIWASDTNHTNGSRPNELTKVEPTAAQIAEGVIPGRGVYSSFLNWFLNFLSDKIGVGVYGDASDGDWTTSSDGNVPGRVTFFDNLTIDNSQTPLYPIFVRGTLTVTAAGSIDRSGGDGGDATNGPPDPGAAGSGASSAGKLGGGSDGGAGADGGAGGSAGAAAGDDGGDEVFGIGGDGGDGGTVGVNTAVGGAHSVAQSAAYRTLHAALEGMTVITGTSSPALTRLIGGAGGGGGSVADGEVAGGGGGGGGGIVVIVARHIVLEGSIDVSGGDGGGANNTDEPAVDASGGGGGGGGVIVLVTRQLTGAGTLVVAGGAGGAGAGSGPAGDAGSDGEVIELFA